MRCPIGLACLCLVCVCELQSVIHQIQQLPHGAGISVYRRGIAASSLVSNSQVIVVSHCL